MSCSYEIFNTLTLSTEQVSNYGNSLTENSLKKPFVGYGWEKDNTPLF